MLDDGDVGPLDDAARNLRNAMDASPPPAPTGEKEEGKDKVRHLRGHGLTYMHVFADLREAARQCGYALAVHGSLDRDLDLVAIPWTETATDAETLVAMICAAWQRPNETRLLQKADDPAEKPHGRRAWSLIPGGPLFVDLSVMPRGYADTAASLHQRLQQAEEKNTWHEKHAALLGEEIADWKARATRAEQQGFNDGLSYAADICEAVGTEVRDWTAEQCAERIRAERKPLATDEKEGG